MTSPTPSSINHQNIIINHQPNHQSNDHDDDDQETESDSSSIQDYHLPHHSNIPNHHHSSIDPERGQLLSSWKSHSTLRHSHSSKPNHQTSDSSDEDDHHPSTHSHDPLLNSNPFEDQLPHSSHLSDDEPSTAHSHLSSQSQTSHPIPPKPRRKHKLYGGGRLDAGGELEIWEVALGIAGDVWIRGFLTSFVSLELTHSSSSLTNGSLRFGTGSLLHLSSSLMPFYFSVYPSLYLDSFSLPSLLGSLMSSSSSVVDMWEVGPMLRLPRPSFPIDGRASTFGLVNPSSNFFVCL